MAVRSERTPQVRRVFPQRRLIQMIILLLTIAFYKHVAMIDGIIGNLIIKDKRLMRGKLPTDAN